MKKIKMRAHELREGMRVDLGVAGIRKITMSKASNGRIQLLYSGVGRIWTHDRGDMFTVVEL